MIKIFHNVSANAEKTRNILIYQTNRGEIHLETLFTVKNVFKLSCVCCEIHLDFNNVFFKT